MLFRSVKQGDEPPQLYNLAEDIAEANDLAARRPDKLKELQAAYDAWNAQLAQPRWAPARPAAKKQRKKQ